MSITVIYHDTCIIIVDSISVISWRSGLLVDYQEKTTNLL